MRISFPGHVQAESGVISLGAVARRPTPDSRLLKRCTIVSGLVTSCENDCNLGALAEMWLCEEDIAGLNDFVFLEVGEVGLGGGIIINRELYRGHDADFIAEFGHMSLDPDGPLCPCGRSGCWGLFVCDRTTWRRYDPRTASRLHAFSACSRQARKTEADRRCSRRRAFFLFWTCQYSSGVQSGGGGARRQNHKCVGCHPAYS